MSRREADYYPSTPCSVVALRDALAASNRLPVKRVLDPAAGAGTLLAWLDVPQHERYAIELRDDHKTVRDLHDHVDAERTVIGHNALACDWSFARYIVANPPFTLLEPFVMRFHQAVQTHADYAIFMTPLQWWQAGKSRSHIPRPQHIFALTWRPPFMGGGAAQHDVAWSMYSKHMPQDQCTIEWLERPFIPRRGKFVDPRWEVFDRIQPELLEEAD
jgi:hypothetical protein